MLVHDSLTPRTNISTDTAAPPWVWPRAAYLHVPFCAHHCGYCDFAVVTGKDDQIERYLDALQMELTTLGRPQAVDTIFIGGGTPTHLPLKSLERLLQTITHWLPTRTGHEFTVEANPGTLDAPKVDMLASHGVNRISLGAQSFRPPQLQVLERHHAPEEVARAVDLVRGRIAQVSLDLIFGVPGQAIADWDHDLRQALALEPGHISTYGLTYEKGTRLWKQRQRGEIRPLEEGAELALYAHALDTLAAAGFEHYEISNHARPGQACRHNQVYWANEAYFGFGLGAARYIQGRRELNTRDFQTYLRRISAGESPTFQNETLPPPERARETMAMQLRRARGIERGEFLEQTGIELNDLAGPAITRHESLGLLEDDGAAVRLTRKGKYVADSVIRNLL